MNCDTLYDDWGLTVRYRALFIGCGSSGRGKYRTLAFENVVKVETGEVVRAHTWIPASEFNYLMKIGDCVSFDAHVGSYEKQGRGFRQLGLGFIVVASLNRLVGSLKKLTSSLLGRGIRRSGGTRTSRSLRRLLELLNLRFQLGDFFIHCGICTTRQKH